MTNHPAALRSHAETLHQGMRNARAVEQLSQMHVLNLDQAYQIQALGLAFREAEGERLVGMKMGFTSRAKMAQMGVSTMIFGRLTDAMGISANGVVSRDRFIHPRVEPEIAFILRRRLDGDATLEQARDAVAAICPAIEIIDSRYRNFKFDLTDVVADNSSSAAFVLGEQISVETGISDLHVSLIVDGEERQVGSTAAILGDPWISLIEAARFAERYGVPLGDGSIVLAGAATEAVAVERGTNVTARIAGLKPVGVTID